VATPTVSWSYERLLQLAPNASSLEQARKLFFAKRWQLLQGNGEWLWGEYKTAYSHLHKAAVRLEPPLFSCSCNSRSRPCKHALALVLLFLNRPEAWQVSAEAPDWVHQQLEKTAITTRKTVESKPKQQEKRLQLMDQGVAELDKWLQNVALQGLATIAEAPEEWENIALRMVDSKLGSIARRLRSCAQLLQQNNWIDPVSGELGLLFLFVRAWQRKSSLTPAQKRELQQIAGWNIRKDSLSSENGVKDNWLVLGITTGTEDKLSFRRTWLRGEKTAAYALLLDFSFGNRGFEHHWVTGSVLDGTLLFYPGQPRFRAAFQQFHPSRSPYDSPSAYTQLIDLQLAYAQALGQSPWLIAFPALLEEVIPYYDQEQNTFTLIDQHKRMLPLTQESASWKLLAISGGEALTVFGEYNGDTFKAISVFDQGRVVLLEKG
jgi:hypothetical protein